MPLNIAQIKAAKPAEKPVRMFDEKGLYLEISPTGSKLWRWKYRFAGKEKRLSFGAWPEVSLADARSKTLEKRAILAEGFDPAAILKALEVEQSLNSKTFEEIAREWHSSRVHVWTPGHAKRIMRGLEKNIFPWLGLRSFRSMLAPELLVVLRRIEARGAIETAHRELSTCGQIFRYGVANGYCDRDIATDLRGALKPVVHTHHPSITDQDGVADLLRRIDEYQGGNVVRCALRLAPLFFVRPGELRHAEWSEFNIERQEWRIPSEKMKARVLHIIPLSKQALTILENELRPLSGAGRYLFPGRRGSARPMSENTVNAALRYMGYEKEEMTGHGFRSMASTLLNELGYNRDHIERQLAHGERNEVRSAYNYAEYLPERRKMMQEWADYLDDLKTGQRRKVLPFSVNG
ncbi:MAG: tyrosine-type recombinase/integrase [Desulfomicrobium sp.]|nr:tyrosine-type recombinase/integrase [Desulfomicrobium sp.]